MLTFDENSDPALASDSGGEGLDFPYLGESVQSTEMAKFGAGSMALGDDALTGFGSSLASGPQSDFGGSISRMTISLWVKPGRDDIGGQPVFFLQRLNGSFEGSFTFRFSASGHLIFSASVERDGQAEGSNIQSERTPGLMMGEWTHFAMTFDGGEVTFYRNGEPVGSPQPMRDGVTAIPALANSRLGVLRGLVSSPGVSHLDDFGFFADTALTSDEIANIYEKGLVSSGIFDSKPKGP